MDANLDKLGKGLALEALKRLMEKTPVDTGRARGNWNVKRKKPDHSTSDNTDQTVTLTKGEATIDGFELSKEALYLSNGLPYIERLENGYSAQAPEGMAKLTVRELQPVAQRIARQVHRG